MNKRKILFAVILVVVSLLSYLGYNIVTKSKEKNEIAKQLQTIPNFDFKTLDSISFTKKNLKTNITTIFIYFNSECDFCHHEAQSISKNINKFKNVQFVFVSNEPIDTIKQFSEEYKLNNQPNITFLYDNAFHFTNQFNAQSIPYILIYNKNNELIKKHNGQLNANGILRVLNQND
ncbi:MAG: redoxin domain-containing protein [Flavobacteriaceae bacterium]|nr:MAG: redoxin domain-containing protein [Flavobacteriaceae bacterium]